ncbi:biopolymer transport protein ExbB [Megasphaera paucivorans]|uniref:Biopolymer transport protein ExbB n=2 Tax=Megasphaera paucivorans TaxID=349095 RepID=A0A1H0AR97_9FIRM|nr:biopolymer transport protein ExbB [Megasphaera paucivorans]
MTEPLIQGFIYFQKGGIVMYLLLLISIFIVSLGIERYLYFRSADSGRFFTQHFTTLMEQGNFNQAITWINNNSKGNLAHILLHAINKLDAGQTITAFLETQTNIAIAQFRKRLYYLNVVITIAPLLGLLGTISGMIKSFSIFNLNAEQPAAITGGVGEALIATAMGLCVAVTALLVHAYFIQRLDIIITDMEYCFSLLEEEQERRNTL